MRKVRGFSCVMVMIALAFSSVTVAHAGGGGLGSGITSLLFDCYVIQSSENSPYTLTVNDQFGTRSGMRLGKARLLCAPTTPDANGNGAVVEHGPVLNPNFDPFDLSVDHLKCYDVNPSLAGPALTVHLSDVFGEETVALGKLSVLCSPASKTVIQP